MPIPTTIYVPKSEDATDSSATSADDSTKSPTYTSDKGNKSLTQRLKKNLKVFSRSGSRDNKEDWMKCLGNFSAEMSTDDHSEMSGDEDFEDDEDTAESFMGLIAAVQKRPKRSQSLF